MNDLFNTVYHSREVPIKLLNVLLLQSSFGFIMDKNLQFIGDVSNFRAGRSDLFRYGYSTKSVLKTHNTN